MRLLRTGWSCPLGRMSWYPRAHAPWVYTQEQNGRMIEQEKGELEKKQLSKVTPHEQYPGHGCHVSHLLFSHGLSEILGASRCLYYVCGTPSLNHSHPSFANWVIQQTLTAVPRPPPSS